MSQRNVKVIPQESYDDLLKEVILLTFHATSVNHSSVLFLKGYHEGTSKNTFEALGVLKTLKQTGR